MAGRHGEAQPVRHIAACLPQARPLDPKRIGEGDAARGAYALALHLARPHHFRRRRLPPAQLQGWLVYAGSANGPGGIAARVRRHLASDKALRWHIDELTTRADAMAAFAWPGGGECAIVAALLGSGGFRIAAPGFGSSDCPRCAAHLLAPA